MHIKLNNSPSPAGVFPRTVHAEQLALRLLGRDSLFNYGRSGLFLAGPHRTGKSTFLKHDLVPQIERLGAFVIYVDLWAKQAADPAELIAEAVRDALRKAETTGIRVSKALQKIKKVNLKAKMKSVFEAEFGIEIDDVGTREGASLAQAFTALNQHIQKPIVLIIDEVQHALTTPDGAQMLFALKAARDALNLKSPAIPQLAILATGSVRSKIAALVLKKSEAFYGAALADFPALDASFVEFVLKTKLAHVRTEALPATVNAVKAFELVGNRPEDFDLILQQAIVSGSSMNVALIEYAVRRRVEMLNELKRQLAMLPPLQRAILRRMAEEDVDFAPFTAAALAYYAKCCGGSRAGKSFSNGDVQRALDALESKHRLVWRSARGAYALDDQMIGELLNDSHIADEMRLLTTPTTEDLSAEDFKSHGFFNDVSDDDWPQWEG